MRVLVKPHKVSIVNDLVNEKEINITKCYFEFNEEIPSDYVKEALFTYNHKTYKQIISNDECDIPNEVLEVKGQIELGVVAYKLENEEYVKRFNPAPDYFSTLTGSLKENTENSQPITPSELEQYQQELDEGLKEAQNVDIDAEKRGNTTYVTVTRRDGTSKTVQIKDGSGGGGGGTEYTAGDNIHIDENNVISAKDTIYDDTEVRELIEGLSDDKVDKVVGKGLSTNDFTNAEKNKLEDLENYDDSEIKSILNSDSIVQETGTNVEIENTSKGNIKLKLKGNTEQIKYKGKSLLGQYPTSANNSNLGMNPGSTLTKSGITFTREADQSITVKGTCTGDMAMLTLGSIDGGAWAGHSTVFPAGDYKVVWEATEASPIVIMLWKYTLDHTYIGADTLKSWNDKNLSGVINFSLSEDTSIFLGLNGNSAERVQSNGFRIKMMLLDANETDYTYEQYVGGTASPNPDYPQDINVVSGNNTIKIEGKNLFDKNAIVSGKALNRNDNTLINLNGYATSDYCRVQPNIQYYLGIEYSSTNYGIVFYDKNKQYISGARLGNVFVAPNNCYYVRFTWIIENYDINLIQLEKGNKRTTYKEYESQSYPINLGTIELCKIGDYQDYIYRDNGKWYLHKETDKVILNGSETWQRWSTTTNNIFRYASDCLVDKIVKSLSADDIAKLYSDNYIPVSVNDTHQRLIQGICVQESGWVALYNDEYKTKTLEEFKTYVSTHNILLYYALKTPTDTEITDTLLINQLNNLMLAYSYENKTYINQNSASSPFILDVTATLNTLNGKTESKVDPETFKEVMETKQNKIIEKQIHGWTKITQDEDALLDIRPELKAGYTRFTILVYLRKGNIRQGIKFELTDKEILKYEQKINRNMLCLTKACIDPSGNNALANLKQCLTPVYENDVMIPGLMNLKYNLYKYDGTVITGLDNFEWCMYAE